MLTAYRIEVTNRPLYNERGELTNKLKDFAIIESPVIRFDYLTLEKTEIKCKNIDVQKESSARIFDANGKVIYEGYVESVVRNKEDVTIYLAPIMNVLNVATSKLWQMQGRSGGAGPLLFELLQDAFLLNGNHMLGGGNISEDAPITIPQYNEVINNVWSYYTAVFKDVGVALYMYLDLDGRSAFYHYLKIDNSITLELDKDYVLEYELTEGSNTVYSVARVNQIVDGELVGQKMYYLQRDGSVSDVGGTETRYYPAVPVDIYTDTTDELVCFDKAATALRGGKFVNEIRVTVANDNKIINVSKLPNNILDAAVPIGTKALILDGNAAYESILTGFVRTEKTTTLVFGLVRNELTKQIALESMGIGNGTAATGGSGAPPVIDVRVDNVSVVDINKIAQLETSAFKNVFSTDEEKIVGYWIDGKPIYRKVWYKGNIAAGSSSLTVTLDNPQTIIRCEGIADEGAAMSNAHFQLPYENPSDTRYAVGLFYRSGAINFRAGSAGAAKNAYVWIDYTKTTD